MKATFALVAALPIVAAASCSRRGDRDREFAQCVDIYRTTYVAGRVSDCLVQRYGWSRDDALKAERDRLGTVHPDSGSRADSGRMGDSAR